MTLEANLLHRWVESHPQALTDCYHSLSSWCSLEFYPGLFIPSLSAFFSFFFFYFQMKFKIILSLRKPVTDILKRDLAWTCGHVPQGSWKTSYLNQVLNSDHLWRNADIIYSFKRVFCADQKVKEVESLLTTKCFPFIVVSVIFWQRLIYKASGP